jgi:hypothetical protein
VFGLRFPIDCGSLRQLRSFSPHVHRTLRASLACFLDLLAPRKPRFFHLRWFVFLILQSYYFFEKQKEQLFTALFFARQRPTLAGGGPPTTIGAEELNFRVRNGKNGCVLFAIATGLFIEFFREMLIPSKLDNGWLK